MPAPVCDNCHTKIAVHNVFGLWLCRGCYSTILKAYGGIKENESKLPSARPNQVQR
jgi:ribosomal protein L37AE/L43A